MTVLRSPIVLFCSERSGSNLVTKMLDASPEVCGPGASHLYRLMAKFSCKFGGDVSALRSTVLEIFRLKSSVWLIDRCSDNELLEILDDWYAPADMVASIYSAELDASRKCCVVLKENSAYQFLDFVRISAERPRFLFMVRDPRGMAASWKNAALIRGGVKRAVETWLSDQEGYIRSLSLMPKETPVAFLRYEDLLRAPKICLDQVCQKLHINFSERMLNFQKYSQSAVADAGRSPMWRNLSSGLKPELASQHDVLLSLNEKAYINFKCRSMMKLFGYSVGDDESRCFGDFETMDALEAHIDSIEPDEKAGYQIIDSDTRRRFETWSSYYRMLADKPIVFERLE